MKPKKKLIVTFTLGVLACVAQAIGSDDYREGFFMLSFLLLGAAVAFLIWFVIEGVR